MKEKNKTSVSYQDDRKRVDRLNKSDKENSKKDLPGNYPPQEDIMSRRDIERVGQEGENFSREIGHNNSDGTKQHIVTDSSQKEENPVPDDADELEQSQDEEMEWPRPTNMEEESDLEETQNEYDVSVEDLQALGPKDISLDMGEDENLLKRRVWPVDMSAKDLDIPQGDSSDDSVGESIGPRDEENDFYSLGGDRHEDDMEGK